MPTESIELPVFELPLAVLPGEQVPLHIFEDRYKLMAAHCLETETSLGILLRTDAGPSPIGCAAEISDVLERYDDGRLNILVTGDYRFRVLDRYNGSDFPMATVEALSEELEPGADPSGAQAAFADLLEAVEADSVPATEVGTAFEIGGRVELPTAVKQTLLESELESRRLDLLAEALRELTEQVRSSKRLAKRAQSNGHGPIDGLEPRPPDA